jgi:hypothetical protein
MADESAETNYEAPTVARIGTVHELTMQNYPASGQDDLSMLLGPGFGS